MAFSYLSFFYSFCKKKIKNKSDTVEKKCMKIIDTSGLKNSNLVIVILVNMYGQRLGKRDSSDSA